jgi:hypothetical protein
MKRLIPVSCLVIYCLLSFSCDPGPESPPSVSKSDWTILYYADGNTVVDQYYTVKIIQDLEQIGSSDNIQIIAMMSSAQTGYNAGYYHIEHFPDEIGNNITSPVLAEKGGADMSDGATLADFIDYGITNYPATHYGIVISGAAAGWQGACVDEIHGAGDRLMTITQMADVFERSISENELGKFDLIFFNTPSMATAEIAYEMRNSADYLAVSQFNDALYSPPCASKWLHSLALNPIYTGRELGIEITSAVIDTAASGQIDRQISVFDMSYSGRLEWAIVNFGDALTSLDTIDWDEVFECWAASYWSSLANTACIDLRQFAVEIEQQHNLRQLAPLVNAADSLLAAIDDLVLISESNMYTIPEHYPGGLNIYLPYQTSDYDSVRYTAVDFRNTGWYTVISLFIESLQSNPGYTLNISVNPEGSGNWIAEPLRDHYQSGDTVLLSASANGVYRFTNWEIQGEIYYTKLVQVVFADSDIEPTANFELPQSDSTVTISGKVWWPGHNLSPYVYVGADTILNYTPYPIGQARVNLADSSYTLVIENFHLPLMVAIEAQDDVNNSGLWNEIDQGDGWGFYDPDGDGTWNDRIEVSPGESLTNVNIILSDYTP